MIQVENLAKAYGDLMAVDDVSFEAKEGAIYGLLGPNGAGKSTTIGCVSGLLAPTSGHISVGGHDVVREPRRAKKQLGVVPQELALYEDLSARENLVFWGSAYGLRRNELKQGIDSALADVGLLDRSTEAVKKLSGGMKRRLNLACGLIHRPRILLLDEPTAGVDPQSRVKLLEVVRREAEAGTCVLYTTHYLEEAESLCDRIGIIDHGHLIAEGTLSELRAQVGESDVLRLSGAFDPSDVHKALEGQSGIEVVQVDESNLRLAVENASSRLPSLFAVLSEAGCEVRETTLTQPSLESLFIKLTGKELRE
jgi:ABC-2 type transport system ATP-binding protein